MSLTLILLRHAKSDWSDPFAPDHDRPLNKRGRKDAPRAGRWLLEAGWQPELVLASSARRAQETLDLAATAWEGEWEPDLEVDEALYHAEPEAILARLAWLPEGVETVLVVGHNPGLEDLAARLTGADEALPTAAIRVLALPAEHWSALGPRPRARLLARWQPKAGAAGAAGSAA
jgi:phosphohistidine phosphatase